MQDYLVVVAAAAAAAYLLRRAWRTWARGDCSGGCCDKGGAKAPALIPASALLGRVKGRPPR